MPAYATKLDTVGAVTYVGQAAIGSLGSAPVWRIKRITETSTGLVIEFVDGNADWDAIWDNRTSYTYR